MSSAGMMSSNIVITDVTLEPTLISYRIQKVFNIMVKQGLAMPMDVRCQYDVNEQIYRSLSTLGIDEVLYPLPKESPFLQLCTMPIHSFLREEKLHDQYRETITSGKEVTLNLRERQRIISQRKSRGERSETLHAGCRKLKRDMRSRRGPVLVRKQPVTSQLGRDTELVTSPTEWKDHCAAPSNIVCMSGSEYRKEAVNNTGGEIKTISLVDNYDNEVNLGSVLTPSCVVDHKIDIFLSRQDLTMPIRVPLEPRRSKPISNPTCMRHDEKPCYDPGSKGMITPKYFLISDRNKSQKGNTDAQGCQRREAYISRKEQPREMFLQTNITDHDALFIGNNTQQIGKLFHENEEEKCVKKCDQIKKGKNKKHMEKKKESDIAESKTTGAIHQDIAASETTEAIHQDIAASTSTEAIHQDIAASTSTEAIHQDIAASTSTEAIHQDIAASTSTEAIHQDFCLVNEKNILEEDSAESRSAGDCCEAQPGRRVSYASDLERDLRGSHSRTSISRPLRGKQKETRRSRRKTPVIMYSESECSLLCQKYNN